jgi:hypothetical protein
MNRRTHYYGQLVTAGELNDAFDQVEIGDFSARTDDEIEGVHSGLVVSQNTVPDLNVRITSGVATDSLGRRVANASTVQLDVSVDSNSNSTAVVTPGNEKYVAIFAAYELSLSDLRPTLDGNSVYWREDETVAWVVVQGVEAAIGVATRPALLPGHVLVADFRLEEGDTAIPNSRIDPNPAVDLDPDTRKQFAYALTGSEPEKILAGTPGEAMQQTLTVVNRHMDGTNNKHNADAIVFDPTGTFFHADDEDVQIAVGKSFALEAPYPGNLVQGPTRHRTHGTNADWRDDAFAQTFSFAGSGLVAGGGSNIDLQIAGASPAGENGYIEFAALGSYVYKFDIICLATCRTPADANYTYRSWTYGGMIQNVDASSLTVLTPSHSAQDGNPANIVFSLVTSAPANLFIRAAGAAALGGFNIRIAAMIRVQCIKTATP